MKVAVRADASRPIGSGHVMRCLALADALRERGADVRFICRELAGHRAADIRAQGFPVTMLPAPMAIGGAGNGTAHADWLEVPAALDAAQTRAVLDDWGGVDWLIVDHYALDATWHRAQRPAAAQLCAIDDLADRDLDVDAVFDPLPDGAARYLSRVPRGCRLLLGPDYALLRREFALARRATRPRSGPLRRLFVSFGGVDSTGETARALDALASLDDLSLRVDVVVGAANPQADMLRARCRTLPRVTFHHAIVDVATLMTQADAGIGAGGVMTWERACLGLPSIVVATAANQVPVAEALARRGAVTLLLRHAATPASVAATLRGLHEDPGRLRAMSERSLALTDGQGAQRVARVLLPPPVQLRPATPADRDPILAWRNDAGVRRHLKDREPITRATHERWFAAVLSNPQRQLLIAELAGAPVAVLRYDLAGAMATVSIYLVPGHAGGGLGPATLRAGSQWLRARHPAVRTIVAEVLPDNAASHRAFLAAGYRPQPGGYRIELTA